MTDRLPSWRPGPNRDAILAFLDGLDAVPVDERVAYLDNDGTMWCERPNYVQLDFFVDALHERGAAEPELAARLLRRRAPPARGRGTGACRSSRVRRRPGRRHGRDR